MKDNVINVDFSKGNKSISKNNNIILKMKNILKKFIKFNKKSPTPKNVIAYRKNIS